MCRPASFVVTKNEVFFSTRTNAHQAIVEEFDLHPDGLKGPNCVNVEISPPYENFQSDPTTWHFHTDQDRLPDWYDAKEAEARVRLALPEWFQHHCCHQGTGRDSELVEGGFGVTQKSGNHSIQIAENNATQTAGSHSKQIGLQRCRQVAGNSAMQHSHDFAIQIAKTSVIQVCQLQGRQYAEDHANQLATAWATQIAGCYAYQTAGSETMQQAGAFARQQAGRLSYQLAGADSIQIAGPISVQRAGVGTTQIIRDGNITIAVRRVTENEANRWYQVGGADWLLLDDEISRNLDNKFFAEAKRIQKLDGA